MSSFVLPSIEVMNRYIPSNPNKLAVKQASDCHALINALSTLDILSAEIPDEAARVEFIRIYSSFMAVRNILNHPSASMICFGHCTPNTQFIIPISEIQHPTMGKSVAVNYLDTTSTELFVLICVEFLKLNIHDNGMFTEIWKPLDIKTIRELAKPYRCQMLAHSLPGTMTDFKRFQPNLPHTM